MKKLIALLAIPLFLVSCSTLSKKKSDGWISLFDGKTFNGWKKSNNPETFTIENGTIKVAGPVSHLYYDGPVLNHNFKNFEFKAMVMTKPGANSGMYVHTTFQQDGFPGIGHEIQVNQSHTDWRRTGSVYGIQDVKETFVKDNEWYEEYIKVVGKTITVKINGKVINEYTEPDDINRSKTGRSLSSGTFALQGHDPNSVIYYKDIMVRPLP
jgi:hypothetical protein